MSKPCAQTSLATDNTPLECDEFISTACVVHPDALVELALPENSTAQDIFNALLNAIINLNNQLGNTGTVTGMEVQDDGSIVINEALKINFTNNLTAVVDGTDPEKVNVSATIPTYTIAIDGSNMLSILQDAVIVSTVDLTPYLDDTNLPQTVSAAIVGTDLVFTRDDASTYLVDISGLVNGAASPIVVSGAVVGSDIILTKDDASTVVIDAASLLDNTNLPRVISAAVVGTELIFTRDDASMFMADVSSLLDNVNLSRIVSGAMTSTDLILTRDDASTITMDLSSLFQNAAQVPFTPTATLTETNTQAVIEQLDGLKENDLGLPATDGFILSSTTAGVRSWIAPPSGGGGLNSVQAGDGIDVDATDPNNPIVSGQGLELITEGGNTGRRLIGSDPSNFGDIGDDAVDLSISTSVSTTKGATGTFAFTAGLNPTASAPGAAAIGNTIIASGNSSMGFGNNLLVRSANEVAVGGYNTDYTPNSVASWNSGDRAFVVGTGVGTSQRRDGLIVTKGNLVTAPELTTTLIDAEPTGRVLITREWFTANTSGGGATNLTFNAATSEVESDTGTNAVIPSADNTNKGLLDFYEEGTFNVTLVDTSGGATYGIGVNQCSYVRINNMVTLHIRLEGVTVSGTAGVAGFQINGLPASIASVSASSFPLLNAEISGSNIQHTYVVGRVVNTSITFIRRTSSTTAQNPTFLAPASFINGRVYVTGSYPVV